MISKKVRYTIDTNGEWNYNENVYRKRCVLHINEVSNNEFLDRVSLLIEAEQNDDNRAEYGKYIIRNLSSYLTEHYGKGYSVDNLKLMRRFYTIYKTDSIGETVFPQFKNYPVTVTRRIF